MQEILTLAQSPEAWIALITLIVMEVVLGIDNLIFISILTNKLPPEKPRQRPAHRHRPCTHHAAGPARHHRLDRSTDAAGLRSLRPRFFSWKDMILIAGGLFLVWKATKEIHHSVDPSDHEEDFIASSAINSFAAAIGQILLLDLVFSVDSIITAVGMTPHLPIMVVAVVVAVTVMLVAANPLANFIERNPTIVMLALAFLLMIGTTLIAEGMGFHVPKGYVYAAMAFSALVEVLNMVARNARMKRQTARTK